MNQDTKTAVITGAGSGMGRASSLKLAEMGMNVVLVDYNLDGAEETLSLIREQGGDGIAVQADVSKADQVEAYVKQAMDQYGRIDVFFNNAGVIRSRSCSRTFPRKNSTASWQSTSRASSSA